MAPAFSVVVPEVDPLLEVPNPPAKPAMAISATGNPFAPVTPETEPAFGQTAPPVNGTAVNGRTKSAHGELNRPRIEIMRLEGLVKKLQAELQAEREYSKALEAHIKTLQESER